MFKYPPTRFIYSEHIAFVILVFDVNDVKILEFGDPKSHWFPKFSDVQLYVRFPMLSPGMLSCAISNC